MTLIRELKINEHLPFLLKFVTSLIFTQLIFFGNCVNFRLKLVYIILTLKLTYSKIFLVLKSRKIKKKLKYARFSRGTHRYRKMSVENFFESLPT